MKKKIERCDGCGVVLKDHPTTCPLCGAEVAERSPSTPAVEVDPDDYRSSVRELREELRRLRGEAEAV